MNHDDRTTLLIKAMTYDHPSELPLMIGIMPAAWLHYGDELRRLVADYPDLIDQPPGPGEIHIPDSYHYGHFTDEWGCVWSNIHEGMESIVTEHPVRTRADIRNLQIPENRDGRLPHGFMYLRLLNLRGFEEAMLDFAEACDELQILIDKVLAYNLIQVDAALPHMGPIAFFGDDLGMQKGLAIGPVKWRRYLKPCFARIFAKARDSGRFVYMHTDGCIVEIMQDLADCGAHMINPQYRANGLDNLVRTCRGKIPICLDLDRQLFPFATPSELESHVAECVESLYLPEGGLGLNAEINYEVPLENIAAIFDALRKYKSYRG
jgi:hypothetical protein